MKAPEIHNYRELYEAVHDCANKSWEWRAHADDCYKIDPTPDEFIARLEQRIEWVKEHEQFVDRYLRRRNGPIRVRVIDVSRPDPA